MSKRSGLYASTDKRLQSLELSGHSDLKSCHLIPSNGFLDGFPVPTQFAAANLTHFSTMSEPASGSSRPRQHLLLSGNVHQNHGPATKYPWSVCTHNVTSRGVRYMGNHCSRWVNSNCYCLENAAEYRLIKNWTCSSCNSPHTLPTKDSDRDPFTILQFNANGIGNRQVEHGEFLERKKVKVAVI